MSDYAIFHDESKGAFGDEYWHAFYWVPCDFFEELAGCLVLALGNSGFQGADRSFKKLGKSKSASKYAYSWLTIMRESLQSCKIQKMEAFDCGRRSNTQSGKPIADYRKFSRIPACKLGVFFLPHSLNRLDRCRDDTARFEATFRMGIKHAAHFLFSKDNPSRITSIWLDREQHYHARSLHKQAIIHRLSNEFREYVSFSDSCIIEGENVPKRETFVIDALDILLGSFRYSYAHGLADQTKAKATKRQLTSVTHDLLTRLNRGDGMKNSRFRNGYSFRKAWLENGEWNYGDLHNEIIDNVTPADKQMTLL